MARVYERREDKLLKEFLQKYFPDWLTWKRVRLGPVPKPEEYKWYQVVRRWADAVVYNGEKVIIIEAKIRAEPGAISQLLLYDKLFPKTPEFRLLKDKPRELLLLVGFPDPEVDELAKEHGIKVAVFCPKWLKEWWIKKIRGE
ncbi:MAG: hypothetical protein DRJ44_03865 [Thermoprotei archaeon]|nr:MAG: hypothetical protein DRJ44_03865 [Thermoprotei archaeon]